jgi:hypothetical protein
MNCPKKITPVSRAHQKMQRQNGMYPVEHQQQQQPRQPQQALTEYKSPLHFPLLADIIQRNINSTKSQGDGRLFAPNNMCTLLSANQEDNEQAGPVETPTTTATTENMEKKFLIESSVKDESGEDDAESSEMIIDENLAETGTTIEKRQTRSGASKANAAARSRSNSVKNQIKAVKNPKKIKTDVLERIAKAFTQ